MVKRIKQRQQAAMKKKRLYLSEFVRKFIENKKSRGRKGGEGKEMGKKKEEKQFCSKHGLKIRFKRRKNERKRIKILGYSQAAH